MARQKTDQHAPAKARRPKQPEAPPEAFFAACGALVDVFWWARRKNSERARPSRANAAGARKSRARRPRPR
jgi:hypothetical protein